MPGGFPLGLDVCNGTDQGTATGTSQGTSITAGAANTAGSFTQLVASSAIDASWMIVICNQASAAGALAVDIAVGASGSEKVIAQQIVSVEASGAAVAFPCSIPAGTRISARAQSSTASATVGVSVILFDGAFTQMDGNGGADSIGFVSGSTTGTTVTASASTNTKGSYAQLVASTTRDYIGLFGAFDTGGTTTAHHNLLDIAIGASGSEQVIIPNFPAVSSAQGLSANLFSPENIPFTPILIPAGTRIAARMQSNVASSAMHVTLYGVYQ